LADEWMIDPVHSEAEFHVKHMMVSTVDGSLGTVSGTVMLDEKHPGNDTVDASIDVTKLDTRVDKRNQHLMSPDFFDVQKFPTVTFKSTKVKRKGKGKLEVDGDLTMHGVTKPVTLTVTGPSPLYKNPWGQPVRAFWATTKINREDYGLTWNKALEAGGVLVGKDVDVTLSIEVNPPPPPAQEDAAATPPPAAPAAQPAAATAPAAK
ncbi:MAG TPA: YceI family protein, partial [Myxococcales bacterium]|nr:YceI family protein [Myxococcales bacterium]